jgi:hypothetical protein
MSKFMLNDSNAINDWNPFVVGDFELPGTWSDPYKYSRTLDLPSPADKDHIPEPSPICEFGVTSALGSFLRGGTFCDPPYKKPSKVSCPMSRPLVPEQNTEPGMWVSLSTDSKLLSPNAGRISFTVILVFIIIALLVFRSRKS